MYTGRYHFSLRISCVLPFLIMHILRSHDLLQMCITIILFFEMLVFACLFPTGNVGNDQRTGLADQCKTRQEAVGSRTISCFLNDYVSFCCSFVDALTPEMKRVLLCSPLLCGWSFGTTKPCKPSVVLSLVDPQHFGK